MKLINTDSFEYIKTLDKVKCIFADPPDNIGLQYGIYKDKIPDYEYYFKLQQLMISAITRCDIFWLSYHSLHELHISRMVSHLKPADWSYKKIIWRYTFGQYNDRDFASGYRPIVRIMRRNTPVYPDRVRIPSARMEMGDSRAAGPRIPDDVWDFPRIVGNSHERQSWHPTQHPVALYQRIINFSCMPDETFVDLFAGSGTCFRAGHANTIGVEIDSFYCGNLRSLYNLETQ